LNYIWFIITILLKGFIKILIKLFIMQNNNNKNKQKVVYNKLPGCIGNIDLNKYDDLLLTNIEGAFMLLEHTQDKKIRLGKITEVTGSKSYLKTGANNQNTIVYVIENITNFEDQTKNLSVINMINKLNDLIV
jgi:hypothetical protein